MCDGGAFFFSENPTGAGRRQPPPVHAAARQRGRERPAVDRDGGAHVWLGGFRPGDGDHHHIRRDHPAGGCTVPYICPAVLYHGYQPVLCGRTHRRGLHIISAQAGVAIDSPAGLYDKKSSGSVDCVFAQACAIAPILQLSAWGFRGIAKWVEGH